MYFDENADEVAQLMILNVVYNYKTNSEGCADLVEVYSVLLVAVCCCSLTCFDQSEAEITV